MNNNDDDNSINIMEANSDGYTTWTFDTGASEHITCNKDILTNFKKEKVILKCANNSLCEFEGSGYLRRKFKWFRFKIK